MKFYKSIMKHFYSESQGNINPLPFLPNIHFQRILDVGCGDGRLTELLLQRCDELVSIEPDPFKIEKFIKKYPELSIFRATGQKTPFPDESFSLVICVTVIEHTKEDMLLLEEIKRILKPGGLAYIVNDAWFYHVLRARKFLMDLPSDTDSSLGPYPHVNLMTPSVLAKKIKKAGLHIIEAHYSPFFRLRWLSKLFDNRVFAPLATKGYFLCLKPTQ